MIILSPWPSFLQGKRIRQERWQPGNAPGVGGGELKWLLRKKKKVRKLSTPKPKKEKLFSFSNSPAGPYMPGPKTLQRTVFLDPSRNSKQTRDILTLSMYLQTHNQLFLPDLSSSSVQKQKCLLLCQNVNLDFCPTSVIYMHYICDIWQFSQLF